MLRSSRITASSCASRGWRAYSSKTAANKRGIPPAAKSSNEAKDLILSVLQSAATKREAKTYISRYAPLTGVELQKKKEGLVQRLLGVGKDLEVEEVTTEQHTPDGLLGDSEGTLRVAIIKIRDLKHIEDDVIAQIGETIARLSRLGVSPIVVVDAGKARNDFLKLDNKPFRHYQKLILQKVFKISDAIDSASPDVGARPIEGLFSLNKKGLRLAMPQMLMHPLSHGKVPVLAPLAYDDVTSEEKLVMADDVVHFLTQKLAEVPANILSVEKIIFVDPLGGIPSVERSGAHVFVNLKQELSDIAAELHMGFIPPAQREVHLANLKAMHKALKLLPPTASGLITTPAVAAIPSVGRNPIIYNVLTDRPVISPSLPVELKKTPTLETTLLREGMPVITLKSDKGLNLITEHEKGNIDLDRLWHLIEDSFGRRIDKQHYLNRVNGKIAGIIIAGDYEGAAIITWEDIDPVKAQEDRDAADRAAAEAAAAYAAGIPLPSPPLYEKLGDAVPLNPNQVAYLDKFAVLKRSQGSSSVADVVFKGMVMSQFPNELLWRSRKDNPVNKWYFDRSRGSLKIPGSEWCMFWTGQKTREEYLERFVDICTRIEPSLREEL